MGVQVALGFPGNPLHDKLTGEHITQSIALATAKESHDYELKKQAAANDREQAKSDRGFELVALLSFVGVLVLILLRFASRPAVLTPTLTGLGGLFAGFPGGIGYGKKSRGDGK